MDRKEAYEKKLHARLDELKAEIDGLEAKARDAHADARLDYERHVRELRDMQQEAGEKLQEIRDASSDAWRDVKVGADSAWDTLNTSVKLAASRFG